MINIDASQRKQSTSTPADAHDQRRHQPTRTINVDTSRRRESTPTPADALKQCRHQPTLGGKWLPNQSFY
jgi:hypothetical protein